MTCPICGHDELCHVGLAGCTSRGDPHKYPLRRQRSGGHVFAYAAPFCDCPRRDLMGLPVDATKVAQGRPGRDGEPS